MADKWRAKIHYTGYPDNTLMFDSFVNLGALVEMDANLDAIETIAITHNQSRRAQEIPNFLRSAQQYCAILNGAGTRHGMGVRAIKIRFRKNGRLSAVPHGTTVIVVFSRHRTGNWQSLNLLVIKMTGMKHGRTTKKPTASKLKPGFHGGTGCRLSCSAALLGGSADRLRRA